MWAGSRGHVVAFAICLAAVACPRSIWDRARIALLARVEGRAGGSGGAPRDSSIDERRDGVAEEVAVLRAALAREEAARREVEQSLAQSTAFHETAPAVRAEAVVPVAIFGGEGAAAQAAAGGARRGWRVRLDAGRRMRVEEGLALADGSRLLGRVVAATDGASEAESSLTSVTFRARCRNQRTGDEGVLRGGGDGRLRFRADGATPDIRPGDPILTSAWSGFAPPNLVAGFVESTSRDPETGLVEAIVRTAADLGRLERALVVRRAGPPTTADAARSPGRGGTP